MARARGSPGWASEPTWLDVEYPGDEERVTELIPLLEVRGRAVAGPVTPYDLVIALDLSASTLLPAGDDIDGDGIVGQLRKVCCGARELVSVPRGGPPTPVTRLRGRSC